MMYRYKIEGDTATLRHDENGGWVTYNSVKELLEKARPFMSHTQKCKFKFTGCDCGYEDFLKEVDSE